ncbi:MAG: hypothetical protein WCP18_00540 [bacterium]
MDAISNLFKNKRGFVLLASIMVMSLMMALALYLTEFTITEMKISSSQSVATQTYYLAESAIAEAIWRIKNDSTWKNNFENDPNWSMTYTRHDALYPGASYTINIQNTGEARGQIIATGFLPLGKSTAQRVTKAIVYKALGTSLINDDGTYADTGMDVYGSYIHVQNGSIFANGNIDVSFWTTLQSDNTVGTAHNLNSNWFSNIVGTKMAANNTPPNPATSTPMPAISFDNLSDPNSYLSQATAQELADGQKHVFTATEFSNYMWTNKNLTINGITYVKGDVNITGPQRLTINGVLISDGSITVGKNTWFCCWNDFDRCGRSVVIINQPTTTSPSGLVAKSNVNFDLCFNTFDSEGLIYANNQVNMLSLPASFAVEGAVAGRYMVFTSLWQGVNILFNNALVNATLGNPMYSPVVTVDHWEEEY